jgi:hypothetical protein
MNKLIDSIVVLKSNEQRIFIVDLFNDPSYDFIDIYIITEQRILYAYDFASGVNDTIPSLSLLPGSNRFVQQDITIPNDKRYFRVIVKEPNANDFARFHLVVLGKKKLASSDSSSVLNKIFFVPSLPLEIYVDSDEIPYWFIGDNSTIFFVPFLYDITAKKLNIVVNTNGYDLYVQTNTFSTTINSSSKQLFTFDINDVVSFVLLSNLKYAYVYSVFIEL